MKKKRVLSTVLLIVFIVVFLASGGYLFHYFWVAKQTEDELSQLQQIRQEAFSDTEEKTEVKSETGRSIQKGYRKLYKKNSDLIGWVTVKNTKIDLKKLKKLKKICLRILFDNKENKDDRLNFIPPFINVQNKPELLIYDNRIEKISKEELRLLKQYSKVHLDFNPIAENETELAKLRKAKINFSAAQSF